MHQPFTLGALVTDVSRGPLGGRRGARAARCGDGAGGASASDRRHRPLLSVSRSATRPRKPSCSTCDRHRRIETSVTRASPRGHGAIDTSMLGVKLRPLEPAESAALGLSGGGLAVVAVEPPGPASGVLEEGDVPLALDDRPITLAHFKTVPVRLIRGDHTTLPIQRGGDRFALRL